MIIREATENDIKNVSEVAKKTFAETFGSSMDPKDLAIQPEKTRSEKYFYSVIETDTILVAMKHQRLIGYIQLSDVKIEVEGATPTDKDQAINAIYIHSDFQGQGVGKKLMDAAFIHPRFLNAENIYVDVWDENKRAVELYKSYNFKVVGKCDVIIEGKFLGYDLVLKRPARTKK